MKYSVEEITKKVNDVDVDALAKLVSKEASESCYTIAYLDLRTNEIGVEIAPNNITHIKDCVILYTQHPFCLLEVSGANYLGYCDFAEFYLPADKRQAFLESENDKHDFEDFWDFKELRNAFYENLKQEIDLSEVTENL